MGRRGQRTRAGRRQRARRGRTAPASRPAAGPDARAGAGAGRRGVRADAGRRLGGHRVVAVGPGGRVALRAGHDRRGQRQAPGAAVDARVRLRRAAGLARRAVHRLPAGAARHRQRADRPHRWSCSTPAPTPRTRPGPAGPAAGRPAARLGPVAARTGLGARFERAVPHRRRRRPVPGVPGRRRHRRGHPGDRRRRRVHRPEPRPGRPVPVRAAGRGGLAAHPGPHRPDPGNHRDRTRRARLPRRPGHAAGPARGGHGHRGGRPAGQGLARAARDRRGGPAGAAPALGARRPDEQLEHLVVAVEPVAHGGPRLRRAAAGPGAVHRVRARASSPARTASGAPGRTPTSWRSPTPRWPARTSTRTGSR